MIDVIGLRPATVMFIDDNPSNRGEAVARVSGIVVEDEGFIGRMLEDPRFVGKDDRELARLKQYKVLEQRKTDAAHTIGSNVEFLRGCGITVSVEPNVEAHIERAVELVNRTNQLNFTKNRLSEDPLAARDELRAKLKLWRAKAGLVHVHDKYGDYGFAGFYLLTGAVVVHFCFSCRTMGMGIEQFIYHMLGRPGIKIQGHVAAELNMQETIDWITLADAETGDIAPREPLLPLVRLRGGCEMEPLGHYFNMISQSLVREDNFLRGSLYVRRDGTDMLRAAMGGSFGKAPLASLGYQEEDFHSTFLAPAPPGTWLVLSFWADAVLTFYTHNASGVRVPCDMPRAAGGPQRNLLKLSDEGVVEKLRTDGRDDKVISDSLMAVRALREEFTFHGLLTTKEFEENLRAILASIPSDARLICLLQSEFDTAGKPRNKVKEVNNTARQIGGEFPSVHFVSVDEVVPPDSERQMVADHFDRLVYFRLFKRMKEIIASEIATIVTQRATN